MKRHRFAFLAVAGLALASLPTAQSAQAQNSPSARSSERAIIFVGGKKRTVSKRRIKRVNPVDQRGINPQPLPPKTR